MTLVTYKSQNWCFSTTLQTCTFLYLRVSASCSMCKMNDLHPLCAHFFLHNLASHSPFSHMQTFLCIFTCVCVSVCEYVTCKSHSFVLDLTSGEKRAEGISVLLAPLLPFPNKVDSFPVSSKPFLHLIMRQKKTQILPRRFVTRVTKISPNCKGILPACLLKDIEKFLHSKYILEKWSKCFFFLFIFVYFIFRWIDYSIK